jgi:hypothetical protein
VASGIISYSRPAMKRRIIEGNIPKWILRHPRKDYIIGAILATCFWVTKEELREIDARAKTETRLTGVVHVVDHDIPINHPRVCGLTTPPNLKVIPWKKNAMKGGAWCEWHGELFDQPEQLRLL